MITEDRQDLAGWCRTEFSGVDLSDKRLNERLVYTAEKLSKQPMDPINKACESWTDTKGAYRLFYNGSVTPEKILSPHQERTRERIKNYPFVLAIQDTTHLNYDSHVKTEGLGNIGGVTGGKEIMGLIMHNTLAMTPDGLPLGLLDQQIYSRAELPPKVKKPYHKCIAVQDKESYRWIRALETSVSLVKDTETRLVTVGDRELDIYEFFVKADELETDFLIRASLCLLPIKFTVLVPIKITG